MNLLNFDDVTFGGNLAGMSTMYSKVLTPTYTPSRYFVTRYTRGMVSRTMDVIYDVLRIYKGTMPWVTGFSATVANGYAAATLKDGIRTGVLLSRKKDGQYYIRASRLDENDIAKGVKSAADIKTTVLLALMPEILKDNEAHGIYDTMSDFLEWAEDDENWLFNDHVEEFGMMLNRFSSNVEMRLLLGADDAKANINIDAGSVSMLKSTAREIEVVKLHSGKVMFFTAQGTSPDTTALPAEVQNASFEGSYAYDTDRQWTEEELNLKAKIPATYVMPDFVPEICSFFKESSVFPAPMRTAYLIGPAGTGKTEAANAICAGLGIPYDHYTCNPSTEIFDFIGQVFPNCGDEEDISFDSIRNELGLPDTEDVINDPVAAYKAVYGTEPSGFPDEGQIIVDMMQKVISHLSTKGANGKNFRYVESGLIRAARLGYGFEIQEIGCVLRPGVAVGLNALLETGRNAFITLPTGEVIKKHPNCTFIFTSNDEYEGTCNLNQSVLDRMALVYRIENPPKEVMKERIMNSLHFPDETVLEKMVEVIYSVSEASAKKEINDGVCGYRSLQNWCMAVMIKAKAAGGITDAICYETGITTVMNKVSQKKECIEELMSSLTYYFAAPKNV